MEKTLAELEKAIDNGATNEECKKRCIYAKKCAFNFFGISWVNCKEATDWEDI